MARRLVLVEKDEILRFPFAGAQDKAQGCGSLRMTLVGNLDYAYWATAMVAPTSLWLIDQFLGIRRMQDGFT